MIHKIKVLIAWVLLAGMAAVAQTFAPFTVTDIRVEGLQRVSVGTVFNYFPLRKGDSVDEVNLGAAMRSLYESGLFKDVSVERDKQVLVVRVLERPVVFSLTFTGNKDIKSEELAKGYKQIGLAPGRVLNRHSLELAAQDLEKTYVGRGRYGTTVVNKLVPLARNRVALEVEVREGVQALVQEVKFIGARAYPAKTLLSKLEMKPASWYVLLSKRDQFSQEKLLGDVEKLNTFYLDNGFFNFKVKDTSVALTQDKQNIVVTYQVEEGTRFWVQQIAVNGIDNPALRQQALGAITVQPKQVYARAAVVQAKKALEEKLGDLGYALAEVQASAEVSGENGVKVAFDVKLGQIAYIRKVEIVGNTKTRDDVIRRQLREYEGGRFSASEVQLSVARLRRLGFFESVSVEVKPAEDTTNQVDVVYTVVEKSTGSFKLGAGYSQTNGFGVTLGLSHNNFLGTGKKFALDVSTDKSDRKLSFDVTNPYFTENGVSLSYGLFYKERDTEDLDVASYAIDEFGLNASIGVPINEYDRIIFGTRASVADFSCGEEFAECNAYVTKYSRSMKEDKYRFHLIDIYASWSRDSRNQAVFPTSGSYQKALLSLGVGDAKYRRISYTRKHYIPVSKKSTVKLTANIAYGKGENDEGLPFFKNYYAGGVTSVRGFLGGSLAPRTENNPDRSLGGSFLTVMNIDFITPLPFFPNSPSVRMDTFLDIGYAFENRESFEADNLRSSAGVGILWVSPIGPLSLYLARPIRSQDGDNEERFQFQLGSIF